MKAMKRIFKKNNRGRGGGGGGGETSGSASRGLIDRHQGGGGLDGRQRQDDKATRSKKETEESKASSTSTSVHHPVPAIATSSSEPGSAPAETSSTANVVQNQADPSSTQDSRSSSKSSTSPTNTPSSRGGGVTGNGKGNGDGDSESTGNTANDRSDGRTDTAAAAPAPPPINSSDAPTATVPSKVTTSSPDLSNRQNEETEKGNIDSDMPSSSNIDSDANKNNNDTTTGTTDDIARGNISKDSPAVLPSNGVSLGEFSSGRSLLSSDDDDDDDDYVINNNKGVSPSFRGVSLTEDFNHSQDLSTTAPPPPEALSRMASISDSYDAIPLIEQTKLPRGGISMETKAVGRIQVRFVFSYSRYARDCVLIYNVAVSFVLAQDTAEFSLIYAGAPRTYVFMHRFRVHISSLEFLRKLSKTV